MAQTDKVLAAGARTPALAARDTHTEYELDVVKAHERRVCERANSFKLVRAAIRAWLVLAGVTPFELMATL